MSQKKRDEFLKTYAAIAREHGIEPKIADDLELDSFTFIEQSKVRRNHAITVRLSAHDLNRLESICQATGASKTTVICRLISAASRFVPECPEAYRKEATYRRRVTVKTRVIRERESTPPPRGEQNKRERCFDIWTASFELSRARRPCRRASPASLSTAHSATGKALALMFAAP